MKDIIAGEGVCAEYACKVNCDNFQEMFRAMDDEYMQARAADIGDKMCIRDSSFGPAR